MTSKQTQRRIQRLLSSRQGPLKSRKKWFTDVDDLQVLNVCHSLDAAFCYKFLFAYIFTKS